MSVEAWDALNHNAPSAIIAINTSLSAVTEDLRGKGIIRIVMPAAWDAAVITFQHGTSATGTFRDLWYAGAEVSVTVAANQAVELDLRIFGAGFRFLKLRSGTSASPVNQTAERNIGLASRAFA